MINYSNHGIKNKSVFEFVYEDFIEWCKSNFDSGTFSTYKDGEPVFFSGGVEISYRQYKTIK